MKNGQPKNQTQSKAMTPEQLEAEALEADKELRAMSESAAPAEPPAPQPAPEPTPETPPPKAEEPPAPEPKAVVDSSEADTLRNQLAEKEARIAELTKRVRDEDGQRGGELAALRSQVERLGGQLEAVMAEKRELQRQTPPAPEPPPEPSEFEKQYPDLAKGVDDRTKSIRDVASKAANEAKEVKSELQKLREEQRKKEYSGFVKRVKDAVPHLETTNSLTEFKNWMGEKPIGSPYTRQELMDAAAASMDESAVIGLYQSWDQLKSNAAPAETPPTPKGPAKPTKESQVAVPASAAGSTTPQKKGVDLGKMKMLKDKIFRFGTATVADRLEYEALIDEEAREKGEG